MAAKSLQWSLESVGRKRKETKTKEEKTDAKPSSVFMDCNFTEAILKTEYKGVRDMRLEYDIFLENGGLHWFIMVRPTEGQLLPYIVFEITTDSFDQGEVIPVMRAIPNPFGDNYLTNSHIAYLRKSTTTSFMKVKQLLGLSHDDRTLPEITLQFAGFKAHIVGTVRMSMIEFCQIANSKVEQMDKKKYNLRTNNCQHFCNMFLREIHLEEEITTMLTPVPRDEIQVVFHKSSDDKQVSRDTNSENLVQFKG